MTNTWKIAEGEFAKRLGPDDVSNNTFTIPLGTRALVVENGIYLGEVPMGNYTPSSPVQSTNSGILGWFSKFFGQQKKEERKADVHAVLVRQEDLPFELTLPRLLTTDDRSVDVTVKFVVQIKNITSFVQNLFGSRQNLSLEYLKETIGLIIAQGLRETIKRISSESLDSPDTRNLLITGIKDAVHNSLLGRYGIDCADIHVAEIYNKEKEALRDIQKDERENDLAVLAAHVELDRSEADIALLLRRNQVKKDLRDAIMSDKFDALKSAEEFEAFHLQIDKQKLLREDEHHELSLLYKSKKDDREAARDFIVRKLELDRNAELDQLSASIAHAQKVKALQHEIELAGMVDDESTRRWRELLQKEAEKSEHDYRETMKNMERDHELNSKNLKFLHTEEWEKLLQTQNTTRLKKEIEAQNAVDDARIEQINRERELEKIRQEQQTARLKKEIEEQNATADARIDEINLESEIKRQNAAYEHNRRLMDDEATHRQNEREERRKDEDRAAEAVREAYRLKAQLETENINAKAALSTDALIATSSNPEIARALADLEKSKHESQAQVALREEMERRNRESAQRERELQDQRVQDAKEASATLRDTFTQLTGQAAGAVGQITSRLVAPSPETSKPTVSHNTVCNECKAENKLNAKFCSECGKKL